MTARKPSKPGSSGSTAPATPVAGGQAPAVATAPAPTPAPTNAPAPTPAPTSAPVSQVLLGSSTLGALVKIGDTEVLLGDVVSAAHVASGLTLEAWNELAEEARDELLNKQIDAMRAEVADPEGDDGDKADAAHSNDSKADKVDEAKKDGKAEVKYPRKVQVSNHGPVAVVEPITGAYAQAGGKATIELRDADHEHAVLQNLRAVLAQNYLPDTALEVEDLPE